MHPIRRLFPLGLWLGSTVLTALPAQDPAGDRSAQPDLGALLQHLRLPIHAETTPDGHSLGLWTGGRDWQASLHDGLAFHPLPSRNDVVPQPFRWRTAAVTVGGEPIALREGREPRASDFRCEFDLGPVVEAYDVRAEGLEQTFVIRDRVVGDLAIRGAVSGLVGTATGLRHGPIDFANADGTVRMRYGAAFAVDALGERLPLATSLADGEVTLFVPGEWLALAAFPVVVDPLLSAVLVQSDQQYGVTQIAIDRDERNASRNIGIAVQREFGSTPAVWFILADDGFTNATVVFSYIASTMRNPRLAFVNGANRWVFTVEGTDYQTFTQRCAYRLQDGGTAASTGSLVWAPNVNEMRQRNMVVGGNRWGSGTQTKALLVWEAEAASTSGNTNGTQVWASLLDVATDTANAPFRLGGGTAEFPGDSELPAVSSDRGAGSWIVAWQHATGFQPRWWDVVGKRVSGTGAVSVGTYRSDLIGTGYHLMAPVVAGRSGEYAIAFHVVPAAGAMPTSPDGHSIRVQRFRWAESSQVPLAGGGSQPIGGANYQAYRATALDYDTRYGMLGLTWRLSWAGSDSTYLTVLGHDARMRNQTTLGATQSVGAAICYDADASAFVLAYGDAQNGYLRLSANRFVFPARTAPQAYGTSCSTATATAPGSWLKGDPDQFLRLANAPGSVFALLALSGAQTLMPLSQFGLASTCNLLVAPGAPWIGAVGTVTTSGGVAEVVLPLPSNLADFDLHAQWLHGDGNASLQSTRGLRIEIR